MKFIKKNNLKIYNGYPIKKLDYIDTIRGIAVLLVLLVHTLTFLDGSSLNNIFRLIVEQGRMGVQLFYIASAFTLFYSLANREKETKIIKNKLSNYFNLNFFIRRFFRIAPMFYIAITFYFYFYINFPDTLPESFNLTVFTLPNLISHFTFTHGLSPYWINSIVPGGWSVGVEFMFYLLVPALYLVYKKYSIKPFYFLLPISIVFSWLANYIMFVYLGYTLPKYWQAFSYFYFPSQFPVFILGIILYNHIILELKSLKVFNIILVSSVLLFVGSLFLNRLTNEGLFPGSLLMLSSILAYFIIFLKKYKATIFGKLLVSKIMIYIGKISYSIYLTHFAMISLVTYLIRNLNFASNEFTFTLYFLVLVIFTIIISTITYKFIEKPGIILGNKLIEKLNK